MLVTVDVGPAVVETEVTVVVGPRAVETEVTVWAGPVTVDTTVVVDSDVVLVVVAETGGPLYENWATPTSNVPLAGVHDADAVYVPLTHSQYGLPVVKLAAMGTPDATVTGLEKREVPYGFRTCN